MVTRPHDDAPSADERITGIVTGLGDWRGATLGRIRELIKDAAPDVVEEVKWVKPSNPAGVPTWSHDGIICTGEIYKASVKVTFMSGASLEDPSNLFNSSLGGGTRRAIDFHEGDEVDAAAFQALVRSAIELNAAGPRPRKGTK
jgi:hypothetical protein